MKGSFKAGFKYISNIFVKERDIEIEIEIGDPTDVKHVAHIGWDGQTGSAPTWMNGFKSGPDSTVPSITSSGAEHSPWSSQESVQSGPEPECCNEGPQPTTEAPSEVPKKPKRKKLKSSASTASRSAHTTKSKTKLGNNNNDTTKSIKVEVATY
ncbi:CRIB domain-containing protein RIC10-like isoform X2 [Ipomoea triloba]|uniref:CRIB domain-containing protein RIC10-like isoform X2 n=1 Tax=Ipomoea triloba TaxID=35885 RepID=UPI00125D6504|nr:CRIB domain-containing protein RIC10-like isoform X2 [Ipomoea triloba]XP_031129410.1 CRIB domain-containing protein RIC10-like isoform X2 [Ipomoea triloba]